MLHGLAIRVRDAGLAVNWGAEVRLERYWTRERCRDLRSGGCVAVSVGFESASQRVLDAMGKGTRLSDMRRTIANLADAGIAVQIMAFTGFPTETYDEAMATISFLERHRALWTLGDVGEFALTAGSMVAKDPARYGLTTVMPLTGQDIHRVLAMADVDRLTGVERSTMETRKRAIRSTESDRPWLGGVDTPHSCFYHARYGTGLRQLLGDYLRGRGRTERTAWRVNGRLVRPPSGTDLIAAGRSLTMRDATRARTLLLRRDGKAFRCPAELPSAIPSGRRMDLAPPVDLDRLPRLTVRALLASRLIRPEPALLSQESPVSRKQGRHLDRP
jgi:anaerobic magnesium-protoporphyrin IX monomethyl ester cyclase